MMMLVELLSMVLGSVAVTLGRPRASVVTRPEELTTAILVSEEVQFMELVMSEEVPSLNCPVALSCSVKPMGTDGLAGVIWMETRILRLGQPANDPDRQLLALQPPSAKAYRAAAIRIAEDGKLRSSR